MTDLDTGPASNAIPDPSHDTGADTTGTGATGEAVTAVVASLDDLAVGDMKMVRVGDTNVALIRSADGVHAIDNACPHEGYGLVTGALQGTVVTCQWHNWKFDAATGRCLMGEEDVACHRVDVRDGEVAVTVKSPSAEARREALWPSLRRGLEKDYVGQMARDSARLLETGANPVQIMAEALRVAAPKADYGVGHEMALAADALAVAEVRSGDDRLIALMQGLAGLSEATRDYPANPVPDHRPGDADIDVPTAIEAEDLDAAMRGLLARLDRGDDPAAIRNTIIDAVSAHHLSYGHGVIYTQKSFELLDRTGWDLAPALLPHLVARIVNSTREDTLPYMRKAMRELTALDLGRLADRAASTSEGDVAGPFVDQLLTAGEAPIAAAAALIGQGIGVDSLLDAVVAAVSERLLRHDLHVEFDTGETFGWLDITHGLTTARAARWAWHHHPGPSALRLALFAVWLAFDTGRSERRHDRAVAGRPPADWVGAGAEVDSITEAVLWRRPDDAVTLAFTLPPGDVAEQLRTASLSDRAGSFIVAAHLVKTAQAAIDEWQHSGAVLPLAATARFLAAPRLERFVTRAAVQSADFVRTGRPPIR